MNPHHFLYQIRPAIHIGPPGRDQHLPGQFIDRLLGDETKPPQDGVVSKAEYTARIEGTTMVLDAIVTVESFKKGWLTVPLAKGGALPVPPPSPAPVKLAETRAVPQSPDPIEAPTKTGAAGIAMIKEFEGCHKPVGQRRYRAYPDPGTGGKPYTIGWGSTTDAEGKPINPGTVWTQEQCDAQLVRDLARFEREVIRAIDGAPTTQNQFDAFVSFHYNTGALGRSTLLAKHKAGDHEGAANEFLRWNRAGNKVLPGLSRRRAAERALYVKP